MLTAARVVVIEDDADLREAICVMLRYEGFEAVDFSDARECIRCFEDGLAADVILLDLMMPIMNGWEFCDRRAGSEVLSRVPVIVITARQSITPSPIGVSAVLLKPFDPDDLRNSIARVLSNSGGVPGEVHASVPRGAPEG